MNAAAPLDDSAFTVDAHGMLSDLQRAGLLDKGLVNLICVDAVRRAFGKRWPDRKVRVWEVAETQLHRIMGDQGHLARLDDENFIVITPTLDPLTARIQAVRAMREVLTHFLGEPRPEDVTVRVAGQFRNGQLSCRSLSSDEVEEAIRGERTPEQSAVKPTQAALKATAVPPPEEREILTVQGRRLRYSVSVDPLIDLAKGVVSAHRVEPKISFEDTREVMTAAARRRLMPTDTREIDVATLERALTRLEAGESVAGRPSLLVSISFLTLTNARARSQLLATMARERDLVSRSVVVEITDFDKGVPKSRLQEAAALLKPFCRAVFARDEPGSSLVKDARSLGVVGLVYEPPAALTNAEDTAVWLLYAGRSVETHAGPRVVVNLSTTRLLPLATAAGFTHCAVRVR